MKKYKVSITRIAYSCKEIEVRANTKQEAKDTALDEAGNYDFPSEHYAEYEVNGFVEVKKSNEDTPREWVSLTEREVEELKHLIDWTAHWSYGTFAKAIQEKLKAKNSIKGTMNE
jgi:hypothetical protein